MCYNNRIHLIKTSDSIVDNALSLSKEKIKYNDPESWTYCMFRVIIFLEPSIAYFNLLHIRP